MAVMAALYLARPAQWALLQVPGSASQAAYAPCSASHRTAARRSAAPRRGRACAAAKSQQPDLPPPDAPPGAVADWASAQFLEAARSNLTKSCLLLALEEEAAAQAAYLEAEGLGPESVAALRGWVRRRQYSLPTGSAACCCCIAGYFCLHFSCAVWLLDSSA